MKIFCIGLSHTGTKSLIRALNMLGFKSEHYPMKNATINHFSTGHFDLQIMEEYDAIGDIQAATYFPQLDKCFPNSKFILTIRNKENWMQSMEKATVHQNLTDKTETAHEIFFMRIATYGSEGWNADRYSYVYDRHLRECKHYFKNRNDLLVMDICAGDGWETLCPFLNINIPNDPFPHILQGGKNLEEK